MEDAILSAIAAMNEPKTCSTTALKKYILENYPGTNSNFQGKVLVHLLLLFCMLREFCSCRCTCTAPLNCSVELAGSGRCSALCAAEMLCGFNSHESLSSWAKASSWDRMHDSLVYSQEGWIVFKYFIALKSPNWFHLSLLWKGQLGINATPVAFYLENLCSSTF